MSIILGILACVSRVPDGRSYLCQPFRNTRNICAKFKNSIYFPHIFLQFALFSVYVFRTASKLKIIIIKINKN